MEEKIKKIIKITNQCINQELTCELCKEKLFLKPVYRIKSEVNPEDNLGHIIFVKNVPKE